MASNNGRPARSAITAEPGPVRDLIKALRDLRERAGNPQMRTIARHVNATSLGGLFTCRLESRELTLAVVDYLNGSGPEFEKLYDSARAWQDQRTRWAHEHPLVINWPKDSAGVPVPPDIRANFVGLNTPLEGRQRANGPAAHVLAIHSKIEQYLKALMMTFEADPSTDIHDFLRGVAADAAAPVDRYRFFRLASIINDFNEVTSSVLQDLELSEALPMMFSSYITTTELFLEAFHVNAKEMLDSRKRRTSTAETMIGLDRGTVDPQANARVTSRLLSRHPVNVGSRPTDSMEDHAFIVEQDKAFRRRMLERVAQRMEATGLDEHAVMRQIEQDFARGAAILKLRARLERPKKARARRAAERAQGIRSQLPAEIARFEQAVDIGARARALAERLAPSPERTRNDRNG
ncbi:hypothetical protein [Streptomyces sp. SID2888]|uniref:hypothetical protein n=1 Tax=Streptomyces sp. SID2888 TaxID=2690256 RepID=UPI00136B1CC8|nr:hypothetical protein [Streptomyces sp. SID2888]MYV45135.1 hypothetical protein [Streptomyces sp. SID2888]